ncbi:hypothetical protein KAR91_83630 [Candidatus Pacearchaeota archaeon]|nr:hypothetical protein [Candidatus Pacearchaeota archaeon]
MLLPDTTGIKKGGIFFRRYANVDPAAYPAWRYHKVHEPLEVANTAEDIQVEKKGYRPLANIASKAPHLMNHMADFEDMSPRQLVLYAREEFDVELPAEASHGKLLKVIWKLMVNSPKNKDRIVLLAQSVRMNYTETLKEIKRVIETPEAVTEREVVYV